MIRRLALAALAGALLAAPAAALTISGRVLKGTGQAPVSGVPVSVHVIRGNEELPGKSVTTGASGSFRFDGLDGAAGLEYYVSTEYEGAYYTEGPIPAAGKSEAKQNLLVFDVGKEFDAVHVQNQHVIVERKDDGLHVTEIMVFQNGAGTAYLGVGVNHAEASGARVGLPASVKEFKPGMGLDEATSHLQGRELTSQRPIPPGQHPVSFTYIVPLSGRMDLSHRVYFPTHQFTVLVDDPALRIESEQLTSGGSREQGGRTYAIYTGKELPVGSEVSVRVGGAGFFSNPKVYPFLVAPFLIAAVLIFASRRGTKRVHAAAADATPAATEGRSAAAPALPARSGAAAPATPSPKAGASRDGDDLAQVYLYLIAALDQGLERGEFSEESHALIRGNLKRRLEVILAPDQPRAKSR